MRRSAIVFLLLAPYIFIFFDLYIDVSSVSFVVSLSVLGLICGLNMVNSLTSPRRGAHAKTYLFWNMVLKLSFVPLYMLCCHILVRSDVALLSATILLFVFLGGYILILTTSSYGWRGLWVAYQSGMINRNFMVFHAFVHGLYFFDVFSAVYCYWRICRAEKDHD